jgi:hypothetical protein
MQVYEDSKTMSLDRLLTDRRIEQVIFHNATVLAELVRYQQITGDRAKSGDQRSTLLASLEASLKGARSVDEIVDFDALKLPENAPHIKERVEQEKALSAERQARLDIWRAPAKHVYESIFLFGNRFEPLSHRPQPVVELSAREWFDSLHLLPDEGIRLSDGSIVTVRLTWSSYFGSIETSDMRELKAEASALLTTKQWERSEWTKKQELSPPDFDDENYVVPDVIERAYAVDPLTGQPVMAFGTIAPETYKSDSGGTGSWRGAADLHQSFVTHWFKSRDEAEKCRSLSQGIVDSTRAARLKSSQKKASADTHKGTASKLQAKLRLLASVAQLSAERLEEVNATIGELDPMLERSKSAPVIKWTADAIPVFHRLVREALKNDEAIATTVDRFFSFVMEKVSAGEHQDLAITAIDQFESFHRKGQLTAGENRTQKIDDLVSILLEAANKAPADSEMQSSKAA